MSEENKAVEIRKNSGAIVPLIPDDAEGVFKVSQYLAKSDLVPKSFGGRAENVFAAIMYGREIGVSGMQALSNIAVVNGRPSVWGELATALVRQSGLCETLNYKFTGEGATLKCIATGKRKGDPESHTEEFSMADAKLAGFDKKDTYLKHPKDMVMWKALHRLFKFLWPDVLKGIAIRQIAGDLSEEFPEAVNVEVEAAPAKAPEAPAEPKKRGPKPRQEAQEAPAAPAAEALDEVPAEASEAPVEAEEPTQPVRVTGTMIQAVKLVDFPDKYAAKVQTSEGEVRYLFENLAAAQAAKPLANRTVMMMVEPLDTPIAGVRGKIVKCEAVA